MKNMETSRNSNRPSSLELAARLDFPNRVFCERPCAITPAQAHDRPWVTPDARQVWLCQRGIKSKRPTRRNANKARLVRQFDVLRPTASPIRQRSSLSNNGRGQAHIKADDLNVKPHERNERTQSGYHGLGGATQLGSKVLGPGTEASAETGAVALAFISRKRGTALVRCAYKVCDPLPP